MESPVSSFIFVENIDECSAKKRNKQIKLAHHNRHHQSQDIKNNERANKRNVVNVEITQNKSCMYFNQVIFQISNKIKFIRSKC